ncbi:MAG: hypothetical protein ACXV8P_07130 [Methylobacter sp.]
MLIGVQLALGLLPYLSDAAHRVSETGIIFKLHLFRVPTLLSV